MSSVQNNKVPVTSSENEVFVTNIYISSWLGFLWNFKITFAHKDAILPELVVFSFHEIYKKSNHISLNKIWRLLKVCYTISLITINNIKKLIPVYNWNSWKYSFLGEAQSLSYRKSKASYRYHQSVLFLPCSISVIYVLRYIYF